MIGRFRECFRLGVSLLVFRCEEFLQLHGQLGPRLLRSVTAHRGQFARLQGRDLTGMDLIDVENRLRIWQRRLHPFETAFARGFILVQAGEDHPLDDRGVDKTVVRLEDEMVLRRRRSVDVKVVLRMRLIVDREIIHGQLMIGRHALGHRILPGRAGAWLVLRQRVTRHGDSDRKGKPL